MAHTECFYLAGRWLSFESSSIIFVVVNVNRILFIWDAVFAVLPDAD